MKKLMIAAAMVCAAAMSYGAAGDWSVYTGMGGEFADPTTGEAIGGVLYFFDANSYSQDDLIADLRDGGNIATLAAANGWAQSFTVGSDGSLSTLMPNGPTTDQYLFEVVKVGDSYYVDDAVGYTYDGVAGGDIALDLSYAGDSSIDFRSDSTATFAANGYGWYSTVPEPTSGLLLLLGVAGLALRRRRA